MLIIKEPVFKARPKWKATRTKSRLKALNNSMSRAIHVDFLQGIRTFKKKIDSEKIYQAWISGHYSDAYRVIPWHELPQDLGSMFDKIGFAMKASGDSVVSRLPAPIKTDLRWDTSNTKIQNYMKERAGKLIFGIDEESRKVVSRAITQSFEKALTPRRVAELIKPSIGLFPAQVTALDNYREGLKANKATPAAFERLSSAYEDQLLTYRSMMIGRTETSMALNEGQLSVWDAAVDQGLIEKDKAKKVWIAQTDPCEDCAELDGESVTLEDSWDSADGPVDSPPLHPNCYCTMEIEFDDGSEAEQET